MDAIFVVNAVLNHSFNKKESVTVKLGPVLDHPKSAPHWKDSPAAHAEITLSQIAPDSAKEFEPGKKFALKLTPLS